MKTSNPIIKTVDALRLDKWLWCARFFKTRSLAVDEIGRGRVQVNGLLAKPSRELKPGDLVAMRLDQGIRTVEVLLLSPYRGSAPSAQQLYQETAESIAIREQMAEHRRLAPEPALTQVAGRPTKRDRRDLQHTTHSWNDRWSASMDR